MYYVILCLLFLAGFLFGTLIFGFKREKPKPIGTLYLNFAYPDRDLLEFDFDTDLDEFIDEDQVIFNVCTLRKEELNGTD